MPKSIEDTLRDNIATLHNILDTQIIKHANELSDKHEYIKVLEKKHASEIAEKNETIKSLKEEIKTLHYTVKGACAEHLSLRLELSPQLLASTSERDVVRYMTEKANKQMAHAVERQLGDRYELIKEYDRALRHIHYLESHMQVNCVKFTQFGMPQRFQ